MVQWSPMQRLLSFAIKLRTHADSRHAAVRAFDGAIREGHLSDEK